MELSEKVVREAKAAAQTQIELQDLIRNMNGQIAMEQHSLQLIKRDAKANSIQLENLEKVAIDLKKREELVASLRETLNMSITTKTYLKQYVAMAEPNEEQQAQEYERLKAIYEKLVHSYESNPEYRRVIDAQKKTKEFEDLINEKREESMRLETADREFIA